MLSRASVFYKLLFLIFLLFCFISSIQFMGAAFTLLGKGFAVSLIETTNNPFVGLFIGILATAIVQSSSCTSSIVVGLTASQSITLSNAIPIVLGANIGTTITNILVSVGHITRKQEFSRAFPAAVCHDIFNFLTLIILFPLHLKFNILEKTANVLTSNFIGIGGLHIMNPIKILTGPVVQFLKSISSGRPIIMVILSFILLFFSLFFIARLTRGFVATKFELYLNECIFNYPIRAFIVGILLTATVQSSSITTSIVVPLVGAGILSVEGIFPYTMGANIGTTITAIIAALGTASSIAITLAFVHLSFNVIGAVIFFPLRFIPISIAKGLGKLIHKRRLYVAIFIVLFFLVPIMLILLLC